MCTFCARAVVRIDQFVVFCCWFVLFVCTWLLFSSFFDTCHAQNTPGVGMESINLCTFCARAVVRIDQFVVFCCWLVLFVCTWLLFLSFCDTCHAQNTPGVGMESINLCTVCARAVVRIDQFVVFCCWLVLFVCIRLLFSSIFLIRTIISEFLPAVAPKSSILKHSY